MDIKESIEATKRGFEKSFKEEKFYNKQTQDKEHLNMILDSIKLPQPGMKLLDLGTGSGYLAFALAEKNPHVHVTGLDIVEEALKENIKRAEEEDAANIDFVTYDGMTFPFEDESFDYITARYCLHHFPDIEMTFKEIVRILRPQGKFFISDPIPNEEDSERFVDEYMQMKKDGHIRFYTEEDFMELGRNVGLSRTDSFKTSIRFPKKKDSALELPEILKRHDAKVVDSYDMVITESEIYLTEQVINITLQKL